MWLAVRNRSLPILNPYCPSLLRFVRNTNSDVDIDTSRIPKVANSIQPNPEINHYQLYKSTFDKKTFISHKSLNVPKYFHPSPASQMTQTMAFGYSLFFKNADIRPEILCKAIEGLATELPPLTGRIHPPSLPAGLRRMKDTVIEMNNAGIEFVTAETKEFRIEDLGPRTWTSGMSRHRLDTFNVPFYAEPFSVEEMYQGKESLFKVKLTRCLSNGSILSVTVNHILADAGRAVRLVERLSQLYKSAAQMEHSNGTDIIDNAHGTPLKFDPSLETPQGFAGAIHNPPEKWTPSPVDHRLTMSQWVSAPYRFYKHTTRLFDVHMVYLPKKTLKRLKAIITNNDLPTSNSDKMDADIKLSTMDAVQSFIATLIADLRRRNLVPIAPEEFTVNVDLLHGSNWKDSRSLPHHVGNAVHILHVSGVCPGTSPAQHPSTCGGGDDDAVLAKFTHALATNARLIRKAISSFRSDPANILRALDRQVRMVSLAEAAVGAAFVVKGADMKLASTTAVTAFPFDNIDFGFGAPVYTQINYQPRFDWWTIIQGAKGYENDDGSGVLCTLTIENRLQEAFIRHPMWKMIAPEAHIIAARD